METLVELPLSLQKLAEEIESQSEFNPALIRSLIRKANVRVEDLSAWAEFDHSEADSYGRTMIYNGGFFEIMTMSWCPGDFSAIHDHGSTQWGAVQVFGDLEHATFMLRDGSLSTLSRTMVHSGQVLAVGHDLVHQMGNPSDKEIQSLHIYGNVDGRNGEITADARLFEANKNVIQRVDGGVFFHLPTSQIKREESTYISDYTTDLRNRVESLRRFDKMKEAGIRIDEAFYEQQKNLLFSDSRMNELLESLEEQVDEDGHMLDSLFWRNLTLELIEAGKQQAVYRDAGTANDSFGSYAQIYDDVIGRPCLSDFMSNYWDKVIEKYNLDTASLELFSIGCGTGLIEEYLIDYKGFVHDNVYGMDLSEGMVVEARKRIKADVGNALELDPKIRQWDISYCGLNVFQYIDQKFLQSAITQVHAILKDEAYFIGDFITSDHIRWYPNLIYSEDKSTLSFRTPRLLAIDNYMYQESEIVNVHRSQGNLLISYEGKHKRYLAPMSKVRRLFEDCFSQVDLYDAQTMEPIEQGAETCESTRYLVVARK